MGFTQADRFEQHINNQISKRIGATPVLMPILQRLGIAETVDERCPGKEDISHGIVISVLALNRLQAPRPLSRVGEWMEETVLEDTFDTQAEKMYDQRLGRTLDDLHPDLERLWQDIVVRAIVEYEIDLSFLHYDITSIYFEGEHEGSDLIDYGYSRDQRSDTKQINLGLNVNGEAGIPLSYRVMAGRTADRTTPQANMQALRDLFERPELAEKANDFILVSDCAMLDRGVLADYQAQGISWLGPLVPDAALQALMGAVPNAELDANPLDYRPMNQPDDEPARYFGVLQSITLEYDNQPLPLQVLVVKSRGKVKLDRDRRQTYLTRLTDRLDDIQRMLNTRRYKRKAFTQRMIDKACHDNPANRFVDIQLTGTDGNLSLTYQVNQALLDEAAALDGRYLLATNNTSLDAHQMLQRFKRQEVVERRNKVIKGPIQIRPIFLHKQERIEGLVFVSMLALLIYTILEMLCRRAGEYITARQVLERFETYAATYMQFDDGSCLKLPGVLNAIQQHLIGLLKCPPPAAYLRPEVSG